MQLLRALPALWLRRGSWLDGKHLAVSTAVLDLLMMLAEIDLLTSASWCSGSSCSIYLIAVMLLRGCSCLVEPVLS